MPTIRTDGLVLRYNEYYLFTYPKEGDTFQFWQSKYGHVDIQKLSSLNTKIDTQFLLMPKSIFNSWEKE